MPTKPVNSRPDEVRQSLAGMVGTIAALHLVGWFTLIAIVTPQHMSIGTRAFGMGVGVTAYLLGMRHAFDADHIAAIDNTTRKLMREGKSALSVGFWFSLGHSSIVFGLTLLLTFGIRALAEPVFNGNSELHLVTGFIGTIVSGGFLYVIATLNLVVLIDIWKVFRRMHSGHYDEATLERQLENRGMMNRMLRTVMKLVSEPWQMYLVGLLFGLGFDTATEIALLVLTGSGAASDLPWYALLCLPILFAAGMSLLDTIDGAFMNLAYGWAFRQPSRKILYNMVVTALSVAVALIIGTVEILGLFSSQLNLQGTFWVWISGIDLNGFGFAIVGLFILTWVVAIAIWRLGRNEQPGVAAAQRAVIEAERAASS